MIYRYLYTVSVPKGIRVNGKYRTYRAFTALYIDVDTMTIELGPKIRDIILNCSRFRQPTVLGILSSEGLRMRFHSEKNMNSFLHPSIGNCKDINIVVNKRKPRLFNNVIGGPIMVTEQDIRYITYEQYKSIKNNHSREYSIIITTYGGYRLPSIWAEMIPIRLHRGLVTEYGRDNRITIMITRDTIIPCTTYLDQDRDLILDMMKISYASVVSYRTDQIYTFLNSAHDVEYEHIDICDRYDTIPIENSALYPYRIHTPTHDIIINGDNSILFEKRRPILKKIIAYADMRILCE